MSDALSPARWWRITPIVFITFSFAYLDRVNYSFAAAGGIGHDLFTSVQLLYFADAGAILLIIVATIMLIEIGRAHV